jgi:outer membrane protein assembly factor BamB
MNPDQNEIRQTDLSSEPADASFVDPVPSYANDGEPPRARRRRRVPPLPAWIVFAAALLAAILVANIGLLDGAHSTVLALIFTFVALMSIAVWFIFFSGYPGWLRGLSVAVMLMAVSVFFLVYRIDGATGWLMPRFVYRFAPRPDELLDRPESVTGVDQNARIVDLATTTPDDFPRFLGPHGTCAVEQPRLDLDWSKNPPRELWRIRIGAGWSAFSAVNGFAVTMEQRGPLEMVTCYDLFSGKLKWLQSTETRYQTVMGGVGPRATPTIHGGLVYTLGAKGHLYCLNGNNGNVVWDRNVREDCGVSAAEDAENLSYGRSNSPLIVDQMLVVPGGGPRDGTKHSLIAYDRLTGQIVWKAGDRQASYASPALANLVGTRQIVSVNEDNVTGHDPATGEPFWSYDWKAESATMPNVSQPVPVGDDIVFLSNGYNNGAALIKLTYSGDQGWRAEKLWHHTARMRTKFTNVTVYQGHVYGLSDGRLECIDLEARQRRWKRGRYGHGQILRVGGALLVQSEPGPVVLVELSPDRLIERGQIPALSEITWNNLCLFGNLLLVRNAVEAACYELPVADGAVAPNRAL